MIVRPPSSRAFGSPAADLAVVDGLWVGADWWERGFLPHGPQEARLRHPVVGHEVVDPKALDGAGTAAQDDVHPLRTDALETLELVDIAADLEDRARLHVAGELRVRDLVVVGTPGRSALGVVDPQQEVRVAPPRAVEERRLEDDVRAGGHGLDRGLGGFPELLAAVLDRAVEGDLRDGPAAPAKVRQVSLLVLVPALSDDVELRVVAFGTPGEAGRRRPLQRRQVLAGEVADQVRGGVDRPAVDQLHGQSVARWRDSSPVTARASPAPLAARPETPSIEPGVAWGASTRARDHAKGGSEACRDPIWLASGNQNAA